MNTLKPNRWTVADYTIYLVLILSSLVFAYPLVYIMAASLSNPALLHEQPILLWPQGLTFEAYDLLLSVDTVWSGYSNTLFYTLFGTSLNIAVTICAAYALARRDLAGRNLLMFFIVLTMFFNGGIIPTYLVFKELGLLDTRAAMIVAGAVSTWNLFIARSYFDTNIPSELREAAKVDGASEFTFFRKIALPLSKPIIAVLILFYGSGHWNAYFNALIYLRDRSLYPLQVFLREIVILDNSMDMMTGVTDERTMVALTLKYAVMTVAVAPLLLVFPFFQRFFVKGVMLGALKE